MLKSRKTYKICERKTKYGQTTKILIDKLGFLIENISYTASNRILYIRTQIEW